MKRGSMSSVARGVYKLIGPAMVVIALSFPVVLFLPLIITRLSFISYNEIILIKVVFDLFHEDLVLFVVVFVFGMVTPLIKMVFSLVCWYRLDLTDAEKYSVRLATLGKLSMLDVMLLAIFIIAFKGVGIGAVEIRFGLYMYIALVLGSFLLNLAMNAAIRAAMPAAEAGRSVVVS